MGIKRSIYAIREICLLTTKKIRCQNKSDFFPTTDSIEFNISSQESPVNACPDFVTFHINPNVAKAGGLQSQGVKGEAVVCYRKPLTTQDLKSSGFPEG
jgi:hypothetical protein